MCVFPYLCACVFVCVCVRAYVLAARCNSRCSASTSLGLESCSGQLVVLAIVQVRLLDCVSRVMIVKTIKHIIGQRCVPAFALTHLKHLLVP